MATKTRTSLTSLFESVDVKPEGYNARDGENLRVPIQDIRPAALQPRTEFDEADLRRLSDEIAQDGILQDIVVRPLPSHYKDGSYPGFEIVAGERRWRAAGLAGLQEVRVQVREVDDDRRYELALIENSQRTELSVVDQCNSLAELRRRREYSNPQLALKVGLTKSEIENRLAVASLLEPAVAAEREAEELKGDPNQKYAPPEDTPRLKTSRALLALLRAHPDYLSRISKIRRVPPDEMDMYIRSMRKGEPESRIDYLLSIYHPSKQQQKKAQQREPLPASSSATPIVAQQGSGMVRAGAPESPAIEPDFFPVTQEDVPGRAEAREEKEEVQVLDASASSSGLDYAEAKNEDARASATGEAERMRAIARDRHERLQGIDTTPVQPRAATTEALSALRELLAQDGEAEATMAEVGRIWREWAA